MIAMMLAAAPGPVAGAEGGAPAGGASVTTARAVQQRTLDVAEYRIEGSAVLPQVEVEAAVYPFLGPDRTLEDVERARAALEKAYSDRGYQTVVVAIPPQTVRDGVVTLRVTEGTVGRLRVRGARWFSPFDVRRGAPSMAEGAVPNFDGIVRDIYRLNQLPDRRVVPTVRSGAVPGTVDVDLNVQDTFPLHGSVELNDRSSPSTTALRLNGTLRYDNLWQAGHSLSFSFQTAPQRVDDGKVFTLSYLARVPDVSWLTLGVNGVMQDSDVSTLGALAVQGRGRIAGGRATFTLPGPQALFHTVSAGLDYKHLEQYDSVGATGSAAEAQASGRRATPVTYWPASVQYGAVVSGESSLTQLGASVVMNVRGLGSAVQRIEDKRYRASASFFYVRAQASRTDELPGGLQLSGRIEAQLASQPLLPSEQVTAGGAESVRGYQEVQASGDRGAVWGVELRSPSLARWLGKPLDEWRFLAFADAGWVELRSPLPEQQWRSRLLGVGGGTRVRLFGHVSGGVDVAVPLAPEGTTERYHPRMHFRVSSEF